jgi:SRSO17 transposase
MLAKAGASGEYSAIKAEALRLFLPASWTSDWARLKRAGISAEYRTTRTKPDLALMEIDRAIAAGIRFGYVLAEAGYGSSAPFRQALTARKPTWAVGIPRHLKVYPADVKMIWPVAKRGRPRKRHVPDVLSIASEDMLADAKRRAISWRTGTKASSRRVLLLFGCGSPTDHRSGSETRVSSICPARRLGSSASTRCREKRILPAGKD